MNTKRASMKKALIELKGGCCQKCGYDKCQEALDFHHRDPSQKEFQLFKTFKAFEDLLQEVEKCDLLCSNCHRELHAELNRQFDSDIDHH